MKKNFTLLALLLGLNVTASFAQSKDQLLVAESLFKDTKEIYFEFEILNRAEISSLTKIISIDHVEGNSVKAFANKTGFTKFLAYNKTYTILEKPNHNFEPVMMKDGENLTRALHTRAVTTYPTYPQYVAMMQQFALDYPSICKFYDLGTLPSGRKILALKITDNPNAHENEPEFLYTSTMHGDETAGYPTMLNYIDYLLTNYGSNARVTNLVNNIEIWINPLANPDGTYAAGDMTVAGATRYNDNGVDLNRNYPDPEDGAHPDGNPYQAETQIFMGFADTMDFNMAANFHGGAEVANYAWDTWATNHADENWWIYHCLKFADTAQLNGSPGYFDDLYSGSNPGVTNGFDWYEVNGGRQDYMHWWHQCREMTLEVSSTKLIPSSEITNHWNYLNRSLLNYMEESMYGIRGIITDQCTGQPIKAKVFISGHDFDSSFVYSSKPVGNYHRYIYPGTYNVTYSAPGYQSVTMSGINVVNNVATVVNVQLQPLAPVANFTSNGPTGCDGLVNFTDLTGSASSWSWNFGDGNTSTDQNPSHQYLSSGTYTVTLNVSNCINSDTEIKPSYLNITVAAPPTTTNDTASACTGAVSLNLSASGTGTLAWYSAPTGGTLVNTGTNYTTPAISTTTTYYVESQNPGSAANVGPADNTIGAGGYFTGASSHYEIFDALQPFTLVSVKVYANSSGNRTIQLRNSGGTVLQSLTVNLPTGMTIVPLNFSVPAGTDLQLGISGTGGNLYRNSSGAAYPYTLPGIVSIKKSSATPPNDLLYYYFFYDWVVNTTCNSSRVPVSAVISSSGGVASVTANASDLTICAGETVNFTASPTTGGLTPTYQWFVNGSPAGTGSSINLSALNNGDVVTCQMTSSDTCATGSPALSAGLTVTVNPLPSTPVISLAGSNLNSSSSTGNQWYLNGTAITGANASTYTPTSNGTYYSIVTDANGCSSDTSNVIVLTTLTVDEIQFGKFTLYPNPAHGSFTVESNSTDFDLEIVDALGKRVMRKTITGNKETINVEELYYGIYFVRITKNGMQQTLKLVIK